MSDAKEFLPAPKFTDYRNINIGQARVVWAQFDGLRLEGWVFPGGGRTRAFQDAHDVAVKMNKLMS